MNKRHITSFALVVLILANTAFAWLIYSQYRSADYYDEENIEDIRNILAQSNIIVDAAVFPKKKTERFAASAAFSDDEYISAMREFSGSEPIRGKNAFTATTERGTYTFEENFSFSFISVRYFESDTAGYGDEDISKATDMALNFIRAYAAEISKKGAVKLKYRAESSVLGEDGNVYVRVREYAEDILTVNYFDAVVRGGEVIYAEGTVMLVPVSAKYTAECIDVMDILINEKRYFEKNGDGTKLTVSSIENVYDMCFDVLGTAYLIPSSRITYTNGLSHTYDLISGELLYINDN